SALTNNTTGGANTATGISALQTNTTGTQNTGTGSTALYSNTTGSYNTATGKYALQNNTTGSENAALGYGAGYNLTTGNNNIDIGNPGVAGDDRTIRIGGDPSGIYGAQTATFIAGINGATITGSAVLIDATTGRLGTVVSSQRFKDAIKPMDKASEVILLLKPV